MYTPRHSQPVNPRRRQLAVAVPLVIMAGSAAAALLMRQPVSREVLGTADRLTSGADHTSVLAGWLVVALPLIAAVALLARPAVLEFFLLRWVTKLVLLAGVAVTLAVGWPKGQQFQSWLATTSGGEAFLEGFRFALAGALAVAIILGTPVAVSMLSAQDRFQARIDRLRRAAVGNAALVAVSALGVAGFAL